MQRINTSTKAADLHGPGKHGFRPGEPNAGILPTQLSAEWCDDIQEEMACVIEDAGLVLGGSNDQLLTALVIHIKKWANPTGKVAMFARATAPAGWVRLNGGTIGSATSGASERANADTHDLFVLLWNEFDNTICSVVGGRGTSAENDWVANKKLTLPDDRGYFWRAWDAGRGINPDRVLLSYEADGNKAHTHTGTTASSGAHSHSVYGQDTGDAATGSASNEVSNVEDAGSGAAYFSRSTSTAGAHTHAVTTDSSGNSEVTVKNRAYLACIKL